MDNWKTRYIYKKFYSGYKVEVLKVLESSVLFKVYLGDIGFSVTLEVGNGK